MEDNKKMRTLPVKKRMHSLYSPYQTLLHKVQRAETAVQTKNDGIRNSSQRPPRYAQLDSLNIGMKIETEDLVNDYDSLNRAVAISALVEKPQTVKCA